MDDVYMREVPAPADWTADAMCATSGTDPELWFPTPTATTYEMRMALTLCAECPVAGKCFAAALERDEKFGIWGGVNFARWNNRKSRRARRVGFVESVRAGRFARAIAAGDVRARFGDADQLRASLDRAAEIAAEVQAARDAS